MALDRNEIKRMLKEGKNKSQIARELGVSRQAIYNVLAPWEEREKKKRAQRKRPRDNLQPMWTTENRGLPVDAKGRFISTGQIKSDAEMDEQNLTTVQNSSMYSKSVDSGERINMLVNNLIYDLGAVGQPIQLKDTNLVRETVLRYLSSCARTGAIPSKAGLSRACGLTASAMSRFMARNPEHPTSRFLGIVNDSFSELLAQASLSGSVHPIVAIHLQKAIFGVRENEPLEQPVENPLGESTSTEDLIDKYADLPDD